VAWLLRWVLRLPVPAFLRAVAFAVPFFFVAFLRPVFFAGAFLPARRGLFREGPRAAYSRSRAMACSAVNVAASAPWGSEAFTVPSVT